MISVSVHHLCRLSLQSSLFTSANGLACSAPFNSGLFLPCEKLSHIVSAGDPATSGLLKINKTAFSSITVLVGLIISSRPGGTLGTPHAPSSVGITFCTYLAGVHGPVMHMPGRPISSVQFSSAAQSCPTFCDPRDCSTPGLPVHYQLPEIAQTHVH